MTTAYNAITIDCPTVREVGPAWRRVLHDHKIDEAVFTLAGRPYFRFMRVSWEGGSDRIICPV